MHFFRTFRSICTFYRSFCWITWAVTLFCTITWWKYGFHYFFYFFWFKVITLGLVFYFITLYKNREFYYYRNLGVSKQVLWGSVLSFDLILYIVLMILTYKLI